MANRTADEQLGKILVTADRVRRYDFDEASMPDVRTLIGRDIPALVAELRRLRGGLRTLAESPDGQEVVSADGLRVSGDGSHVVTDSAFTAVHVDDLADSIGRLLEGS